MSVAHRVQRGTLQKNDCVQYHRVPTITRASNAAIIRSQLHSLHVYYGRFGKKNKIFSPDVFPYRRQTYRRVAQLDFLNTSSNSD